MLRMSPSLAEMAVMRSEDSDDSQSTTLESRPESHLRRNASTATRPVTKQEHDGHRRSDASSDAHARRLGRRQDPPLARGVTLHTHPLARQQTTADQLVDFDGPDGRPLPPALHRPAHKKVGATLLYGLAAMTGDLDLVRVPGRHRAGRARAFGVGEQVVVLGFSLFLLGFRAGPAGAGAAVQGLRGPRRRAHAHVRCRRLLVRRAAAAQDLPTLLLTRFFGALFASAPRTPWSSWGPLTLDRARDGDPAGGRVAAGGPSSSSTSRTRPGCSWPRRGGCGSRRATGHCHAQFEEWDVGVPALARKFLVWPLQLLCTPSCLLVALYGRFCYGILYMQLGAIPYIFGEPRGWGAVARELPFVDNLLGSLTGAVLNVLNQLQYNKTYRAHGGCGP
ncbi:hypothetical protein PG999_008279 [Apiospora kogelbergensis]|uniref:Uncharacterized protein n=1 Tax=Apiospora kogelbergensis TaxID=1337665 RepID=A0AAW0QLD3_9PEZI